MPATFLVRASVASETQLLQDLAIVVSAAALVAVAFRRFRVPALFGFLAVGVLLGPHSPLQGIGNGWYPAVKDEANLRILSDLGVVLLLFGLGISFNLRQLRAVGGPALVVTLTQGLLMLWLGYELGAFIGWDRLDNLFLGACLSISSTTITVRVLRDLGKLHTQSSGIIFGVLVLQDVVAVLVLVLLAGYVQTGDLALIEAGTIGARMLLFLVATVLLGVLLVPRIVDFVARRYGGEALLLTVLGLGLSYAVLSNAMGFHVGLGAFLMGALVAEAKQHERVEQQLRPVSDLFAAVFFVTMGTLVDPGLVVTYWKPVLAVTALILIGKFLSGAIATFLAGYSSRTAIDVGAGLAQIGEFSFVIAALGASAGVTGDFLFPIMFGATAITSLVASVAMRYTEKITNGLGRMAPSPLRTYVRLYASWMGSVRDKPGARQAKRVKARRGALLSAVVFVAVLGGAWLFQSRGHAFLIERGLRDPGGILTYWGLVLAAILPLLFAFFKAANRWLDSWEMPAETAKRAGPGFRRVIQVSFYLMGAILMGLPVLAATAPFLDTPVIAVAWVAMVASAAVILWASINKLHLRIESNIQAMLDDEHLPLHAPQVVRDLMTADFPWEIRVESLEVEPRTWAAGQRLGEIDLRSATGASLILVERGDARLGAPGPETLLLPGDRVTLLGTREQIGSARAVLAKPAPAGPKHAELRLGRLYVGESSTLDGVRLQEAALPSKAGLQVVAILRDDQAIANPGAHERLRPGDIILVLGAQDQIAAASHLVAPGTTKEGPDGPASAPV